MAWISPNSALRVKTKGELKAAATPVSNFTDKHVMGIVPSAEVPDPQVEVKEYKAIGSGRVLYNSTTGKKSYQATIPIILQEAWPVKYAFSFGTLNGASASGQYGTFGNINSSGPQTISYSTTSAARLASFEMDVILKDAPGLRRIYKGCVLNNLELSGEEEGELKANFGIIAADMDTYDATAAGSTYTITGYGVDTAGTLDFSSGTTFPAPTTAASGTSITNQRPWMFYDATVQIFGVTIASVKSFNIGLNNNIAEKYYFDLKSTAAKKGNPSDLLNAYPEFTCDLTVVPDTTPSSGIGARAIIQDLIGSQSVFDVVITLIKNVTTEATPNTLQMVITAKDCLLESSPHHIPEDNEIESTVTCKPRQVKIDITDGRDASEIVAGTGFALAGLSVDSATNMGPYQLDPSTAFASLDSF